MAGWYHQLSGLEFEQPGDSESRKTGGLQFMGSKGSEMTEQQKTTTTRGEHGNNQSVTLG